MSFTFQHVRRRGFKVFVAMVGASGTGKTLSALRLARGMAKVAGGEVMALDTEGGRMVSALQDRDLVDGRSWFRYAEFPPPYTPARYAEAIVAAADQGAAVVVIDSLSHEHDGEGGTLDRHASYSGGSKRKNWIAWASIREEQRVLHRVLEKPPCHVIATFKAKEKLAVVANEDPSPLGWMPIGCSDYVWSMTARVLLKPDAPGTPSDVRGLLSARGRVAEADIQKCPAGLERLFDGDVLTEADGELVARWANLETTAPVKATPAPQDDADALAWRTAVRRYIAVQPDQGTEKASALVGRLITEAGLPGPPSTWPSAEKAELWDRVERLLDKKET